MEKLLKIFCIFLVEAKKQNVTDDELYIHIDTVVRKQLRLLLF